MRVSIDKINISQWDARLSKEEDEDIEALMSSIEKDGLINPITLIEKEDGYLLLAGRRRLLAHKLLGRNEIEASITQTQMTEHDFRRITYVENNHRKELNEEEKAIGLLQLYESAGFGSQETLRRLKTLYNAGYQIKKTNFDQFKNLLAQDSRIKVVNSLIGKRMRKFIEIVEAIGYSPNTQYQSIQIASQIEAEVLSIATKYNLKKDKIIMLTNSRLRKHTPILVEIAKEVASLDSDEARTIIYQAIRDIETGAIKQVGNKYYRTNSDKDKPTKELELKPSDYYLKIETLFHKIVYLMTDRQITRGEFEYNKEIINKTKSHRISVVKSLLDSELFWFQYDMQMLESLVHDLNESIDHEILNRKNTKEMVKQ